jgi:DNA-binding NarL/FixJ family response regulator
MTPRARVLVADDHAPTRLAVCFALRQHGFDVCAEANDATSASELALRVRPDICVLDVHMPGSGTSAARSITAIAPEVRVVMLTVSRDDDDLFAALDAGACGYLLKGSSARELADALGAALAGSAPIPQIFNAPLIREFRKRKRKRVDHSFRRDPDSLTRREWDVAELLREGLSTAQIAGRLYISETTVRRHVGSILRKLDVPDRAAAIRLVESV